MYTIGNLVYGVPWNSMLAALWNEVEENNPKWAEDVPETFGFEELYSGNADELVAYLGVSLTTFGAMDEIPLSELTEHTVTPEHKAEVVKQLSDLPDRVRKLCGSPDVWIVWSTS